MLILSIVIVNLIVSIIILYLLKDSAMITLRKLINDERSTKFLYKQNESDIAKSIRKMLHDMMIELNADRSYIYELHDGISNRVTNVKFLRLSKSHEFVSENTSSHIKEMQNLPTSIFSEILDALCCGDRFWKLSDVMDIADRDYGLYQTLIDHNCRSVYIYGLHEPVSDGLVGFIGVDYTKKRKTLSAEEMNTIKTIADTVSAFMMLKTQSERSEFIDGNISAGKIKLEKECDL